MSDDLSKPIEHDGTAEAAAMLISDEAAGLAPARPEINRAPDGKFAGKEPAVDPVAKAVDPAKAADPAKVQAQPAEDDGEYFEIEEPGEDGKPVPKRYKADEVWQGFQKAKELEGELAKVKQQPALSSDHEAIIADTLTQRGRYIQALQQWQQFNQPKEPDPERLLNPNSKDYDPDGFYRQMQEFRSARENHSRVAAELQNQQMAQDEQRQLLEAAHHRRERDALLRVWPEIAKPEVARQVADGLAKHFGIDADTLKQVFDHRFYAVAKDALAYREGQAKAKDAVKVVSAKPKLVRGGTRTNISPKAAQFGEASSRLAKSGSLDDAADALGALLN